MITNPRRGSAAGTALQELCRRPALPGDREAVDSAGAAKRAAYVGEPQATWPVGQVPRFVVVGDVVVGELPGGGQPADAAADVGDPQVAVGAGHDVLRPAPLAVDRDVTAGGDPPDRAAEEVGEPQGLVRPDDDRRRPGDGVPGVGGDRPG